MNIQNELSHHGIKGQEWGIKHGPPYPIDPEKGRTTVSKGKTIKRMTVNDERKFKGHAYVTFQKQDNERYKGFFGAKLYGTNRGKKDVMQLTLKAANDLVSPSKRERVSIFMDMFKNDPEFRKQLSGYYKESRKSAIKSKNHYEKRFNNFTDDEIRGIGYSTFAKSLGGNKYIRDKYFRELKKRSYSFVIDDLDSGRFGNEPAIIIDRNRSTIMESARTVPVKEIMQTFRKEGLHVKHGELYHHGILGQKWGLRRFQNPDGSLTEEGLRRYGAKNLRELSDEELVKKVGRLRLEDEALRLQSRIVEYDADGNAKVKSPKESQGYVKEFIDSAMHKTIIPAATDVGKKYVTKYLEDKLSLNTETQLKDLEKQSKMATYKANILKQNNFISSMAAASKKSDAAATSAKKENQEAWEEWFSSYDFPSGVEGSYGSGADYLYEWLKN